MQRKKSALMQFSNAAKFLLLEIAFRFVNGLEIQATFGLLPPRLPFLWTKRRLLKPWGHHGSVSTLYIQQLQKLPWKWMLTMMREKLPSWFENKKHSHNTTCEIIIIGWKYTSITRKKIERWTQYYLLLLQHCVLKWYKYHFFSFIQRRRNRLLR